MAIALLAGLAGTASAQKNVLQPSDAIIASSSNHPSSEGVKNAIDGTDAKYLNFDSKDNAKVSGFVVTPSVGVTWVTGIAMKSANDGPERDPLSITIEGSNDDAVTNFVDGTWEVIYKNEAVPVFAARFQTQTFTFENFKPFKHYRWTVLATATANTCCMQIAEVQLLGTALPKNVVQPSDAIVASSSNHPSSEGVKNAIDGADAKYLNFDSKDNAKVSGFVVTPSVGATLLNGISMKSANDAPERDPMSITLEGSNDDAVTDFASGTWELVYKNTSIPAFAARFQTQTFLFDNYKPFKHYRWTVVATATANTCCMQVAEVQLLGSGAPKNTLQPGDAIIASSSNHPSSEGVKNAIDGTDAKYLNFDSKDNAKVSGFVVTPSVGATTITGLSMKSANDAPERDPLSVTVEGSNDDAVTDFTSGTWETIYKNEAVPAFATRFATQTFYFPNKKSFKHYRWTVLATATANTCCMQIAEVGLLAATSSADCTKTAFVTQPIDTPVLSGARATFLTVVNGPWDLQWYADDAAIPGATATAYTTDPITTANAGKVYTVKIVGCQTSTAVKAVIFTPSTTKSIGIHFVGGGANGAPTYINTDDIVGVQQQAYWINATNTTGSTGDTTTLPDTMNDSDNKASTITFEYATSGQWGAGTDTTTPTGRLLNGTVGTGGVGVDQTMTFHNVPAGKHAVLVYCVASPLQFPIATYKVGNQSYYASVMNSDAYKAAPGFYRALSTDPANPSVANFVRFDNVSPDAAGDILLTYTMTKGSDNNLGVNAIQLVLNPPAIGAPPTIAADPTPTVAPANGSVSLSVKATGDGLTYQWRRNGRPISDGGDISGATSATLSISNFSADNEGIYNCAIANAAGSVSSKNASLYVSAYDIQNALAGYWKFDETSGTSAANAVAGGKPAKINGTASWAAGQTGNSFKFDGGTYGQVDTYPKATKALSAAGWVRVDSSLAGMGVGVSFARNGEGTLRAPGDNNPVPAGQFDLGLALDATDSTTLRLWTVIQAGGAFPTVTAPAAFPLGSWQHVAFTADGAQLRLFLNGQQVAVSEYFDDLKTSTVEFLSLGARLNTNDTGVVIDDTPNFMIGQMDDFAVWNRLVTPEEIGLIYNAGKSGQALATVKETPPAPAVKPTLSFARSGANVTISWDATRTGYTLEGAAALPATAWTAVTGVANNSATVPAGSGAQFFRLRK